MSDITKFYRDNLDGFQGRWSPIMNLLKDGSPLSVTTIADRLGLKHPYVVRLSKEMMTHRLLLSTKDTGDGRRRLLRLSSKGKKLVPLLVEQWSMTSDCQLELIEACGCDILEAIAKIEDELNQRGMYDRLTCRRKGKEAS